MKQKKEKYYSLSRLLSHEAQYRIVFGERSSGKTYAILKHGIEKYYKGKGQIAYLRRWTDDFTGKRGSALFAGIVEKGEITKITKGEWTGVYYYGSCWYLCKWEDNKRIIAEDPFCYGFSLSGQEHDKAPSYPNITTIFLDEFLARTGYLSEEFVLFTNVLSTIIRKRDNVEIFMAGNTINKYACPYFSEMGLTNVKRMKHGDIDVYTYGESTLKVAIEYAEPTEKTEGNNAYFAFGNPKLNMITDGSWELALYPHCPCKYFPKDILFSYFIKFDNEFLQCDIVNSNDLYFTFIHRKTTPLKNPDTDLIYSQEYSPKPNYKRRITNPASTIEEKITRFYKEDRIFYQDNEVGEIVRNYLIWCSRQK